MKDIDPLWCAWFSGLTDGEGYFGAYYGKTGKHMTFEICLRYDDGPVLETISKKLECGKLTLQKKAYLASQTNAQIQIRFRVVSLADIIDKIIPLFDAFPLRSKKANDYKVWRRLAFALKDIRANKVFRNRDYSKFITLVEELRLTRKATHARQNNPGLLR